MVIATAAHGDYMLHIEAGAMWYLMPWWDKHRVLILF